MSAETRTGGYQVVGTRPIRHDALDKVTGRALYGADVHLPGTVYGKVARSPHAHAIIRSIDTREAEAMPGVLAVITAKDLPSLTDKLAQLGESVVNLRDLSANVLAPKKVLYHGHPVAAVCAVSTHVAEEAVKRIQVDYEVLPAVLDVLEAMKEGSPLLHQDLKTHSMGKTAEKPSNVASHFQWKLGDVEKGFAKAEVVVERSFRTATVHQGYIEPHNTTARWNPDGSVTIWCSTQGPFAIRSQLSEVLKLPVSKIKVIPMEIGGGFGAKFPLYVHPLAAVLAKKVGRPVKMTLSRVEELLATGPAPGSYLWAKMGATRDGRLVAAQAKLVYEAGAYPGSAVGAGGLCIFSPYHIENTLIDGYDVVVNKARSSAYRAPGATNAAFASETLIDEICEKLKMDPIEFRLKNAAKEGDPRADGPKHPKIGCRETMEAARNHPHYRSALGGKFRGRGVASGFWINGGGQSSAVANVMSDGTVSLIEGSPDIGGTRTTAAMQIAEVLGLRAEEVNPMVVDTDTIGYTDGTGGSRTTFATGLAAIEAGRDILCQMKERAAKLFELPVEDVEHADGEFRNRKDPKKTLTFKAIAEQMGQTGGPIVGRATVQPGGVGPAFATHVVDVEVDPDTGKVTILRYTAVQDAGKAIHPSYVEGQMQGGVVQGIGWALNEEFIYDEQGRMLNSSFLDYRMPTALDLPMIDTVIVEVPNPGHPYGVRGVGEVPIVPPPAALANAIYHAIGVRIPDLPMSPRRILEALGKA
ncbi:MAG: xanthine dehydrogenase family protein molybdopterin-binding subunit [Planctomycetes bacterium]|nr:xanthine dehydrogenase family protein molybdopterin-binding subunit [Planctomycetota bacterium]